MKKLVTLLLAAGTLAAAAGCSGGQVQTDGGLTKLSVEVFDRNNAPEGQGNATDNRWTQYINERVAQELGIDVEYIACPRAQEKEKLNVWLASNSAPDISFTYDYVTMSSYAEQNGLYDLTQYISEYGDAIEEKLGGVLDAGMYEGKQFAVPGMSVQSGIAPMKIRKDWLDKLGMPIPTTIDELYTTLKAFKEQDPGNVGKENVVPFALPAPGTIGTPGFYLDLMYAFGVRNDVDSGFDCMLSGNYDNGTFKSPVDMPEAREFYRFMNKLYKEGLIHKEFVIDNNGTRYDQHVSSGVAGFVDCNEIDINNLTRANVPEADWALMEPLAAPNGERSVNAGSGVRWLNFVPKSSKCPEAAVQFINWMISEEIDTMLYYGIEGEDYDINEGVITVRDKVDLQNKLNWIGNDLNLIGAVNYRVPEDKRGLVYTGEEGKIQIQALEISDKYGKRPMVLNVERPIAKEKASSLQQYLFEGAAKVIVADDFDAQYDAYIDGWNKLGGADYDNEIAMAISAEEK